MRNGQQVNVEGENVADLQLRLARALQELGDLEAATAAAERAISHCEPVLRAQFLLRYAFILCDQGERAKAKALARESLELEQSRWPESGRHLERDALLDQRDPC